MYVLRRLVNNDCNIPGLMFDNPEINNKHKHYN